MEVAMEIRSALNIAAEQPPPPKTYADFLRTIVDENPEFLPTLERLEGNIASEAISPLVQAYIVDFGSRSILNQYVWETKDVGDVAERLPTPGTKTRIIYIGYNMEKEGEHGLFLSLIDSLGIHLDLEPSFVDAVLLKMSKGVGRRDPSPKRFLDLNLEGTDVGWTGRSMDAIICIKEPKFEGTSSLQFQTTFILFNDYPIS